MGKDYYTQEMKETAKQVNLINFLQDEFPDLITYSTKRKRYEHPLHNSLVINPSAWHQFSRNEGGDTIEFLIRFAEMDCIEAIKTLSEYAGVYGTDKATYQRDTEAQKWPQRDDSRIGQVITYLTDRGLKRAILDDLIDMGNLFADIYGNAVFTNDTKTVAFCRGTYGTGNTFKRIYTKKSNEFILFQPEQEMQRIYITESPIDSISLYQVLERPEPAGFCCMCGLKKGTVKRITEIYTYAEIYMAIDWDKAGNAFYEQYKGAYKRMIAPARYRDTCKDWNGLLCQRIKEKAL